ncbi:5925_t:CDS:2 [Ambispora gerdemannii]|uniref:5925_t:CDS:1 n=1 Tax=Ambispora gerdemannii TaxID=144530 RepID=A0A9N8V2U4_9GLOM|nr:5925_t:CDS:2 [Ambispora gerdemannii]
MLEKKLVIEKQAVINLNLANCSQLKHLRITNCFLENITLPEQAPQLEYIDLSDNDLNLSKLQVLDINATNIDSGCEYLPTNLLSFTFGSKGKDQDGRQHGRYQVERVKRARVNEVKDKLAPFLALKEGETMEDLAVSENWADNQRKMEAVRRFKQNQVSQIQVNPNRN